MTATAVHLAFLLHRRWAPYAQWRGETLARLPGARRLLWLLDQVNVACTLLERQAAAAGLLDELVRLQRQVGLPADDEAVA